MKTLILSLGLFLIAGSFELKAEINTDEQKQIQIVNSKDLPEIAQIIEEHTSLVWPKLISNSSQSLSIHGGPNPSDLGMALLNRIRSYEKNTPRDTVDSLNAVSVYASLSRGLQNSGGYINLCLADAANRLAVARLAELLINSPNKIDQVKSALGHLDCVRFSTPRFLLMIHEEPAQKVKAGTDLTSADDKSARDRIFSGLGVTMEDVLQQYGLDKACTGSLVNNLDIAVLLVRMGHTDVEANVNLAGLIEFLKRGGTFNEIHANDFGPFNTIMNGSQTNFHSELMKVTEVSPLDLLLMMKQFQNNQTNSFIKTALQ